MSKKSDSINKAHTNAANANSSMARRTFVGLFGTVGVASLFSGTTVQTLNQTVLQGCETNGLRRCRSATDIAVPAAHMNVPAEDIALGLGAAATAGATSAATTRREFAMLGGAAAATYPISKALGKWLGNQVVDQAVAARDFRRRHFPDESAIIDGDNRVTAASKPGQPEHLPASPQVKSETRYRDLERSRERIDERRR